jgi:Spy/CpxP family protein refolding chaperone
MMSTRTINVILSVALCASLSFNVAFLAAQRQAPPTDITKVRTTSSQQFAALTNTLDLSPEQRQACLELNNTWNAERKVLGESIGLLREQVRTLMEESPVDLIALRERTDRIAELHHERRKAGLARMEEFLTLLTPDQAKTIRKLRAEHLVPPPPPEANVPEEAWTRFDANQDGQLDDNEREAALRSIQDRAKSRDSRMKQLREKFDANEDGELDPEERRALREHLHQHRGGENHPGHGTGPRGPRGSRGRHQDRSPNRGPGA